MRVYRKQFVFWYTSRSSLTIREGISMLSASKTDRQKFPHYTWGYIGVSYLNPGEMQVPSLYVRVYRNNADMITACRCSLTIREGISNGNRERFKGYAFPHYTWGYIAALRYRSRPVRVPSLYVRVYRTLPRTSGRGKRSLTIREGISRPEREKQGERKFPHYTWGYIVNSRLLKYRQPVPSLYVRVYRFSRIFCRT